MLYPSGLKIKLLCFGVCLFVFASRKKIKKIYKLELSDMKRIRSIQKNYLALWNLKDL